jgi:hypothetical protein
MLRFALTAAKVPALLKRCRPAHLGEPTPSNVEWLKAQWISNEDFASLIWKLVKASADLLPPSGKPVFVNGVSHSIFWPQDEGAKRIGYVATHNALAASTTKARSAVRQDNSLVRTIGAPSRRGKVAIRGHGGSGFKW